LPVCIAVAVRSHSAANRVTAACRAADSLRVASARWSPAATSAWACSRSPSIECQAPRARPQPSSIAADARPWPSSSTLVPRPIALIAGTTDDIRSPIHCAASVGWNGK
jgi:hypothetical protein